MKKNLVQKNKKRGVVVLFAVLVSIILVSVAMTITSIALRQTILSNTGRESEVAFYAANTALECARYWDLNSPEENNNKFVFPISGQNKISNPVSCAGNDLNITGNTGDPFNFTVTISSNLTTENYCASVTVTKTGLNNGLVGTKIEAYGYNQDNCNNVTARTVQRGLEMYYES